MLAAAASSLAVEPGLLEWLAGAVWLGAVGVVVRGLTARRRMQNDFRDARSRALAVLETSRLVPVLSDIVLFVGRRVDWGVARMLLGQPEERVPVQVSHADLAAARRTLVTVCADAANLDALQDEVVNAARRQAWWCLPFLPGWAYLVFWASQTGLALPVPLTALAFGVVCASAAAVGTERLAEMRAGERFATLERQYEPGLLK